MALKIDYKIMADRDSAYEKAKVIITPEYTQKIQVKSEVTYNDSRKIITSKGSGFTLTLSFFEKHCEADLELSILLRPLKTKIIAKVEEQISKYL